MTKFENLTKKTSNGEASDGGIRMVLTLTLNTPLPHLRLERQFL